MVHLARSRALSPLAFALVIPLLLAGCGGEEKKKEAAKTPTQVMASAKKHFDDASSVHIALSTDSTPSSGNGVLGATGDVTHDPAFEGDVKVVLSGLTATVPITSIGGKVYAKLPLQTSYSVIKPSEYGAPDPADFADPEDGLSGLLSKLEGLKKGEQKRSGDTILTSYTGTLPGAAVKKIIPSAVAKETYETSVGVDEKGYATTVKVTGPFFTGSDDVTYDVKFTGYDKGVKITAPAS
jgi:lipoprotein LprG